MPFSQLEQLFLSAGDRVKIYSMTPEEQNNVVKRSGWKAPMTIPANTYKNQPKDILTVSHLALIMVTTDFPDDLAFNILTAMKDNVDELKKLMEHFVHSTYNAKAKIEALGLPMNGGAKKFLIVFKNPYGTSLGAETSGLIFRST